jgi:hypothetical protein
MMELAYGRVPYPLDRGAREPTSTAPALTLDDAHAGHDRPPVAHLVGPSNSPPASPLRAIAVAQARGPRVPAIPA